MGILLLTACNFMPSALLLLREGCVLDKAIYLFLQVRPWTAKEGGQLGDFITDGCVATALKLFWNKMNCP